MGVSYYVYVGPFIEAPNSERTTISKYMGCGTKDCANCNKESTAKFCSNCGQPIKQCEKNSIIKPSNHFDVYEECDERLHSIGEEDLPSDKTNVAVFQPNQGKFGHRFSAYDPSVVALDKTVIDDETTRFNVFFAKDIARINEVFGKAEVKWGVIAYTS
jgi:hypothetical protein